MIFFLFRGVTANASLPVPICSFFLLVRFSLFDPRKSRGSNNAYPSSTGVEISDLGKKRNRLWAVEQRRHYRVSSLSFFPPVRFVSSFLSSVWKCSFSVQDSFVFASWVEGEAGNGYGYLICSTRPTRSCFHRSIKMQKKREDYERIKHKCTEIWDGDHQMRGER